MSSRVVFSAAVKSRGTRANSLTVKRNCSDKKGVLTKQDLNSKFYDNGFAKICNIFCDEMVVESMPKAFPTTKKVQISSRNSSRSLDSSGRMTKKPPSKLKPLCVKLSILFVLVASLGCKGWDLYTNFYASTSPIVATETIVEIQQLMKKSFKETQNNLESIEARIETQMNDLGSNIEVKLMSQAERFQFQAERFQFQLKQLGRKTEQIEEAMEQVKYIEEKQALNEKQLGRKTKQIEEAMELVKYIEERQALNEKEKLSLDGVRAVAEHIVEEEIERHCAQGARTVDYALKASGGMVVVHSELYEAIGGHFLHLLKRSTSNIHPLALNVLEPNFGEPSHCLPLKGSSGYIVVSLRTSIFPEAVTLEHVAQSIAYDRSDAPKDFRIFGWRAKYNKVSVPLDPAEVIPLGQFKYDLQKSNVQMFPLSKPSEKKLVNMIRLDILSNHGSVSSTCICRLRIHGTV